LKNNKSGDYDQKLGDRERLPIFRGRLLKNLVDLVTVITVSRKVRPANWKNRHFFFSRGTKFTHPRGRIKGFFSHFASDFLPI